MIIIPIKWLFHWEYTQHFQTNPNRLVTKPIERLSKGQWHFENQNMDDQSAVKFYVSAAKWRLPKKMDLNSWMIYVHGKIHLSMDDDSMGSPIFPAPKYGGFPKISVPPVIIHW